MRKAIFSGTRWISCRNRILFLAVVLMAALSICMNNVALAKAGDFSGIEMSFFYRRMSTMASNQLAVWVEDQKGTMIKTLMVTDFTAGRRGYRNREMSLPVWVKAASPESITDTELDALSSATPRQGQLAYIWDFTDEKGANVPEGIYIVRLEGTLYWKSAVIYSAVIDTTKIKEEYTVKMERTDPNNHDNESMISAVTVKAIR